MAIPLTFIESARGVRLAKHITKERSNAYPNVKALNSHSHFVSADFDGLKETFELFQDHANAGHAFIKGILRKPLENESRKGHVDKYALTQLLVIDIDGYTLPFDVEAPLTQDKLTLISEHLVQQLPGALHNVSYIAHASSSLGLKADTRKVSMHLVFLLSRPVGPDGLKEWLISLNFRNENLCGQLGLSPQNTTLKYVIDPCLSYNSHILYIAPPVLEGVDNPFANDDHRWLLVKRNDDTFDLVPHLAECCPQANQQAIANKITELRKAKGLKKHTGRYRVMRNHEGERIHVLANPDQLRIDYAYENDGFVYFNVNGGDSNAYYCPKHNPDIIYNFKDEPPFEFAKASPKMYEWYCTKYAEVIRERADTLPLVFRDFSTDKHYSALVNVAQDRVERIAEINKNNIDDWMADQGRSVPEPMPTWDYKFDPALPLVFDPDNRFLNQYQMPDALKHPTDILPEYQVRLGEAKPALSALCPTIYKVVYHMVGSRDLEFELFVNWLAAAIQLRQKLVTAWIFSGTPGTGKGLFYERILRPLAGPEYVQRKRIDHLEDKYNGYLQKCLFMVYDEFRLSDSKNDSKILNHIKDEIAAETGTIRDMFARPETKQLYTNYMFFSNHTDVIRIEDGDRRFSVAPPQLVKLTDAYPDIQQEIPRIDDELPQFAAFLAAFTIDEQQARTCLENEAKANMKIAALGWHEQFCLALRHGDLDYFIEDMLEKDVGKEDVSSIIRMASAQKIVKGWVQDAVDGVQSKIPVPHLFTVFNAITPKETTPKKFATLLGKNDVNITRSRIDGDITRVVLSSFISANYSVEDLTRMLGDETNFKPSGEGKCLNNLH